jgi:dihydrofolate synthase/folylpolyglutamate synthase
MQDDKLRDWMTLKINVVDDTTLCDVETIFNEDSKRSRIQVRNMNIAATAVLKTEKDVSIPSQDSFSFPGRFEEIEDNIFIDVAHNPPAVATLAEHIAENYKKVVVIYGAMKDKDIGQCLELLAEVSERIYLISLDYMSRGADVNHIISRSGDKVRPLIDKGLNDAETFEKALNLSQRKGLKLLVTGSFYTIDKFVNWRKNACGN